MNLRQIFLPLVICTGLTTVIASSVIVPKAIAQNAPPELSVETSPQQVNVTDLKGFKGTIVALQLTPDGRILLVGSGDGLITAVDTQDLQPIYTIPFKVNPFSDLLMTSDGEYFVGADEKAIAVFKVENGRRERTLTGHAGNINGLAISPDNQMLVTVSSSDRTIRIWEPQQGTIIETLGEDIGPVTTVIFSPDGRYFVNGSIGTDRTIKFWDSQSLQLINTYPQQFGYINSIAMTSDGRKLVAAVKNYVKVWDINTSEEIFSLKGPSLEINEIAISPDNRLVATGNKEGTIMLFDINTGQQITTLSGHKGWILSLSFSPNGKLLYSGAEDKIVKIWDISGF